MFNGYDDRAFNNQHLMLLDKAKIQQNIANQATLGTEQKWPDNSGGHIGEVRLHAYSNKWIGNWCPLN